MTTHRIISGQTPTTGLVVTDYDMRQGTITTVADGDTCGPYCNAWHTLTYADGHTKDFNCCRLIHDKAAEDAAKALIHTHFSKIHRDCDSTYTNEYIKDGGPSIYDLPTTFPINGETPQGSYTATFTDSKASDRLLLYTFRASCPTDEGFASVTLRACTDNCDRKVSLHRDSTAESMGY